MLNNTTVHWSINIVKKRNSAYICHHNVLTAASVWSWPYAFSIRRQCRERMFEICC